MRTSVVHLSFLVAGLFMLSAAPVSAQGNSFITDLNQTFWIPCANGGAGEWVNFTGSFHIVFSSHEDGNGGVHFQVHYQPQNAKGIGLTTGDEYVGTGLCKTSFNGPSSDTNTYTEVCSFKLIGKGQTPSLKQQTVAHFTVNPNGDLTATIDLVNDVCN